ncbi:hypothetical protein B1207_06915 [Legionella quinlivanii]|uniref:HTH cro/C1-type domain-containing protein n=1 Tax=Legionella quinlivanii TaxID=45073 RepID=A0A364LKM8_9GAMM|nr:XRE family transcriptional regulator [Legionella quinlivanii]RAP37144.1 hypothetical protein B1207_06915 [Legionella quinlivanii]
MNIKEQIGQRIQQARKAKNLTQAKLAELAGNFSQSRLNNWEKGIRTPGLEEVKCLAKVLGISPSYLMCLSEQSSSANSNSQNNKSTLLVPLLDYEQATDHERWISSAKTDGPDALTPHIPLNEEQMKNLSCNTFALRVSDKSMAPLLLVNDIVIIDPDHGYTPGAIIAAHFAGENKILIRELKQLNTQAHKHEFELIVKNDAWANTKININGGDRIIGIAISYFRNLL